MTEPVISPATRAYWLAYNGLGVEDVAVQIFGKSTEQTREKARALIDEGRRNCIVAE